MFRIANLFAVMAVISLPACARVVVKEDGTRHVTGFVSMEIKPTEAPETFAGEVADVHIAGLGIYSHTDGGGIVLGWTRLQSAHLRNNAAVIGDFRDIR